MNLPTSDSKIQAIIAEVAERIQLGIDRKQVVLGQHKLLGLLRRKLVGFVWATEDLSKRSMGKLKIECERFEIPLFVYGQSSKIGEATGEPSTKVYLVKKSFSGFSNLRSKFVEVLQPY